VLEECDKLYKNAGVKRELLLDSSDLGWNAKVTVVYVSRLNREATATHINRSRQKIYVTQVVEECYKLYKRGRFTTRRRWEKTQV